MTKNFCDLCLKEIKRTDSVDIYVNGFSNIGFYCSACFQNQNSWSKIRKLILDKKTKHSLA